LLVAIVWPSVKLLGLWRADLEIQGAWIGGFAQRVNAVTPGGPGERAGLRVGDVLEFDPGRDADWVLAGYRPVPEGFRASVPVRHPDGARSTIALEATRLAYLPGLDDRLAYLVRLGTQSIFIAIAAFMVWARPGLMTWPLFLVSLAGMPWNPWYAYHLAFERGFGPDPGAIAAALAPCLVPLFIPFALCFPYGDLREWSRRQRVFWFALTSSLVVLLLVAIPAGWPVPFEKKASSFLEWVLVGETAALMAIAALVRTYSRAADAERARLRWALLGMVTYLIAAILVTVLGVMPWWQSDRLTGAGLTPANWVLAVTNGVLLPMCMAIAILRDRVVDVQFAVSRTVVYGVVTTLVLLFLAAVHWLLGRAIEHSGLAFGLEGVVAIGLGLVLHRATHHVNRLVDRVLFRKHHAAEERLRRVTAALPFATTGQSIAEALVLEPARNLALASAALFYRESAEGPLRRVLSVGWSEAHVAHLDPESLLLRYLHAEHEALRLIGEEWLPAGMPEVATQPVLAIPVVAQHVLTAVVLYGAHVNSTLPDPDEVELLRALALATAASHQQVRIATLTREKATLARENSALQRENELEKARNKQLEALSTELREIVRSNLAGAGQGVRGD
jgi:hypothetical protein